MRVLAAGNDREYKKYKKVFQSKFIFLNEYTTSVKAEHDPRGPEGPYRFVDRSVPVIVFKRWDGETLVQQLGFHRDKKQGVPALARLVDRALKKNGPVVPPKALRSLLKSYKKGEEHLAKGRHGPAIREFQAVLKGASNRKKFPEAPDIAEHAQGKLDELKAKAKEELTAAADLATRDPAAAKKELNRIRRDFGKLDGIAAAVKEALAALPK